MLKKIANEMKLKAKNEQKTTQHELSRGLIITYGWGFLSLTRKGAKPSPVEEKVVLDAFEEDFIHRRESQKGEYFIIRYLNDCLHAHWTWQNDVPICMVCGKSFGEWGDERIDKWFNELFPHKLAAVAVKAKPITPIKAQQVELFPIGNTQGNYSYE